MNVSKPHFYFLKIVDFEKKYHIQLPHEYKLFLTEIGNAGESFSNSAAGPFYGIYPFGEHYQLFFNDFDATLLIRNLKH